MASADSEIYAKVIAATGGRHQEIEQCGGYVEFFQDLAADTTVASRKMCVPSDYAACDLATVAIQKSGSPLVAGSDYTLDESGCVVLSPARANDFGHYDFTVKCP